MRSFSSKSNKNDEAAVVDELGCCYLEAGAIERAELLISDTFLLNFIYYYELVEITYFLCIKGESVREVAFVVPLLFELAEDKKYPEMRLPLKCLVFLFEDNDDDADVAATPPPPPPTAATADDDSLFATAGY